MALQTTVVEFLANTRQLDRSLDRSQRKVGLLGTAFRRVGITLAAAFSARAIVNSIEQTVKATDALARTAKGVGFGVSEYERLTFALEQVGVSAESARIGLGDLQKRLGNPNFAKFYKQAGLDPKALQRMSPAQQLETALGALQQYRGNQALLVARAGGIFEEQSGKDFAKVIKQWEDFTRARRDYDRLIGGRFNSNAVKEIQEVNYQTKLLDLTWTNFKRQMVGEIAPDIIRALKSIQESGILQWISEEVTDLAKQLSGFAKELSGAFEQLRAGPKAFGTKWDELAQDVKERGFMGLFTDRAGKRRDPVYDLLHAGAPGPPRPTEHLYFPKYERTVPSITYNNTFQVRDTRLIPDIEKAQRRMEEQKMRGATGQ